MNKKFAVIGHVDTGKSCLCGHLLYLFKHVSEHEMNKIIIKAKNEGKEQYKWSRVLDIYEDEMIKSKTHEFTSMKFGNKYELIDTPGHLGFVRSMISGISQNINICVLLVSMLKNEFESSFERGMLKKHLILARAVGIKYIIIACNKMDLIDWNEDIYKSQLLKVKNYLKSIRWNDKYIYSVPISAYVGTGLISQDGYPSWCTDQKSFINILDNIPNDNCDINSNPIINSNKCNAKVMILELNSGLVTQEYICNGHINDNEVEVTFKNIINKMFLRKGENGVCKLSLSKHIDMRLGDRIILRKDEDTIGFGKIDKIYK